MPTDPGTGTSASESSGTEAEPTESGSSSTSAGDEVLPCAPFVQECPDGFKCMPYADDGSPLWNARGCFPVADDPAQLGAACEITDNVTSGLDNCDVGLMCWGVDGDTGIGQCAAQCEGSPQMPSCPEDTVCLVLTGGVVAVCEAECDPLAQDCGESQSCYPAYSSFLCAPFGAGEQGEACVFANECGPGLMCLSGNLLPGCDSASCCSAFCDVSDVGEPCVEAEGAECLPWFLEGEAPAGLEYLGICAAV